ncbi:MAG: hypothetical protein BWY95_01546 [Bacteroidetes bacterium ADurb.BinA104]|nr:MAG: hypothetical protein BWY95_01546 [Bacteroidetes bacterium ADurb.BinA104]
MTINTTAIISCCTGCDRTIGNCCNYPGGVDSRLARAVDDAPGNTLVRGICRSYCCCQGQCAVILCYGRRSSGSCDSNTCNRHRSFTSVPSGNSGQQPPHCLCKSQCSNLANMIPVFRMWYNIPGTVIIFHIVGMNVRMRTNSPTVIPVRNTLHTIVVPT